MKTSVVLWASLATALSAAALSNTASAAPGANSMIDNPAGNVRILERGQRPVVIHPTVSGAEIQRENAHATQKARPTRSKNLTYHGGVGGIGVETAPKVYLVFFGSQWTNNDPSGEASREQSFLSAVGGSSWLNSVTQYCQGVASGTTFCNGAGQAAGNPSGILQGVWFDTGVTAPSQPTQSQLAAEAVRAAQHFGNTASGSNNSTQYVIATAHNNNASGFGTQYCAWHSSTSSSYGNIAYTNLPYMTDAGASCGANYNGLGANAGQTIVEGHELAETMSDQFPNGGWLDGSGAENGDKCAWIASGQGATTNVNFAGGGTFPVQSLWSNAFNSNAGGCVLSY